MYDLTERLLAEVDQDLVLPAVQLINAARAAGVPLVVISGVRSLERNRDIGGAERSQHLFGRAIDVSVLGYTTSQVPTWWWSALGHYGESLGLRWGGRFAPADLNHFDLGQLV